jgi:hypothetical protein
MRNACKVLVRITGMRRNLTHKWKENIKGDPLGISV